jgi:hypothetical protein
MWPDTPTVYPASTAVLELINTNVVARWEARFPGTFISTSDPALGADVRSVLPAVRFETVESYAQTLLEAGGIGLKVWHTLENAAGIEFEFYQPTTFPQVFTPDSGIIVSGSASLVTPRATDVIVGGPGEEAARAFREYTDMSLSQAHRRVIEVFRDATGAPTPWPNATPASLQVPMYYHLRPETSTRRKNQFEAFLVAAGAEALVENGPLSGASLQMSESEGFQWNRDYRTGDILTVSPSRETAVAGLTFTQRITSTTITQSQDEGFTVTPQLGERVDDPTAEIGNVLKQITAALNRRASNY